MENHKLCKHGLRFLLAILAIFCTLAAASHFAVGPQLPAATTDSQGQAQAELAAQADQILQEMSRITGLPIKSPVKKKVVNRAEVRKLLIQNLHTDYTPQQIHVQEATLRAFGLISRSFDLQRLLVNFYTEQAAGFYDPRTKTMYMADWIPSEMQGMLLAHELTHALQDQNFNLGHYMRAVQKDDDAEAARQAVVEGYATAAMFQRMIGNVPISTGPSFNELFAPLFREKMAEFPVFSKAPFFFRMQALFPYIQGGSFIEKALSRGDWKSLNVLFTSPPESTKAIYQPSVYFNHVSLPRVELPEKTPLTTVPGLKRVDESTMGELGFDSLLGQFLAESKANAVSANWMGDRYIVYENPTRQTYALVARTKWASQEDALAFFRNYLAVLAKKYPALSPSPHSTTNRFIAHTGSGEVVVLHTGNEVRWAEGVPSNKVDAMKKWLESLK